jgi:hypothetical protein
MGHSAHLTVVPTVRKHALHTIRARLGVLAILLIAGTNPATAQQGPPPPFYALLPHNYPCPLIRVCSTQWGICAIPHAVRPGTPCHCQAATGEWLPGVCVH